VDRRGHSQRLELASEWVIRLSRPQVSEAEFNAWLIWIQADAQNLRAFESLQELWAATKKYPPPAEAVCALLSDQGRGRVRLYHWLRTQFRPSAGGRASYIAGTCLIIMAIVALLLVRREVSHRAEILALSSAVAQNRTLRLNDGSVIEMGGLTTVDVALTSRRRLVKLRSGEVYFEESEVERIQNPIARLDENVNQFAQAA